jgi:hypothetical protein
VKLVKQMRKYWDFDYIKITCELLSEDFADDPEKLKMLVRCIMLMEKKWSFVVRKRDRKASGFLWDCDLTTWTRAWTRAWTSLGSLLLQLAFLPECTVKGNHSAILESMLLK